MKAMPLGVDSPRCPNCSRRIAWFPRTNGNSHGVSQPAFLNIPAMLARRPRSRSLGRR